MYLLLEVLGTIAFATSGAMVAIEKKMDILGVIILGTTTAVGGGIIRDILIGVTPPASLRNPMFVLLSIFVSLIVFFPSIRNKIDLNNAAFVIVDAIGLGAFTVVGIEAVASYDSAFLQVFMGVITGVGGGVIRDVFACEKPMIFVRHFYACASICGAVVCTLLYPLNKEGAMLVGIVLTLVLRILAAKYKWHLPKA